MRIARVLARATPASVWRKASAYARLRGAAGEAGAFLASFRKSGRTWLRYILSHYLNETLSLGVRLDLASTFMVVPNFDLDPVRGMPAFRAGPAAGKAPPVLVTHRSYSPSLFRGRPILFLVRDPRDVMVSAYFHAVGHKRNFSGDVSAFLRDPELGMDAYVQYHNRWGDALRRHPHLIASYEDLSADTAGVCRAIVTFLGWQASDDALAVAIQKSSFDNMRKIEVDTGIPGHEYDRSDANSMRMRKGVVGGYAETLSVDDIDYIEERIAASSKTGAGVFDFARYGIGAKNVD